jgi:hypothetical protein
MPWVGTPDASQEPRPHGCCASACPVGRAGRRLRYGSISGLLIPFTGVPAYGLPVYASPGTLPYPTQDSVPDCWLGFVRVAISDDWTFCACKAQLPPHRTFGSRIRRFDGWSEGDPSPQPERHLPACQRRVHPRCRARSPTPRRRPSHRSTSGRHSSLPFRPSARSRVPTRPSADFCEAVREDCSTLSPAGHPADLPRSAVIPSVHRRRIDQAPPTCGWRALLLRARSPRLYHTSYPVRVPRPARSFHASFRPHLTVTPWRFPCPSAPRTPGQETFTPKHDSMHGTHAGHEPRRSRRRLHALVRPRATPKTVEQPAPWTRLVLSGLVMLPLSTEHASNTQESLH